MLPNSLVTLGTASGKPSLPSWFLSCLSFHFSQIRCAIAWGEGWVHSFRLHF